MIKGCLEWQRIGLAPPQEVRAATAAYLEAEDAIATWMAECCKLGPNEWTSSSALFGSWTAWAQKTGEVVGSQKAFLHKLEGLRFLSFNRKRPNNRKDENPVSGFDGIRMKLTYEE
jgi:putative DNA primase/helicase